LLRRRKFSAIRQQTAAVPINPIGNWRDLRLREGQSTIGKSGSSLPCPIKEIDCE
jgi:hypothetical protein